MSIITEFFIKPRKPAPVRLPAGSFTINREGQVLSSTLAQSFPSADLHAIGKAVLTAFSSAQEAGIAVNELNINYLALKLVVRRMRGGAILFFEPRACPEHEKQRLQTKKAVVPGAAFFPSKELCEI